MRQYRTERDSMGDVRVPVEAYFGAQTLKAVENYPISGWTMPPELIHALGLVKYACAALMKSSSIANKTLTLPTAEGRPLCVSTMTQSSTSTMC